MLTWHDSMHVALPQASVFDRARERGDRAAGACPLLHSPGRSQLLKHCHEHAKELACSVQVWVPSMASVRGDSGEKLIAVASTKVWPHTHKGHPEACRGDACFLHDQNKGSSLLTGHHPLCKLRADCALSTRSSHSMQRSCEGESRHCLHQGRTSTLL